MWNSVRGLPDATVNALRWVAAIPAAALPKRRWPRLEGQIPVSEAAPLSALVTILLGAAIGIPGFIEHTTAQVSRNNQLILDEAQKEAARPEGEEKLSPRDWGRMFVNASSLSLFTFILLTPAGWMSTYLGVSGMWRGIASLVDEPFGDPILTGIDALFTHRYRTARTRTEIRQREALEGPEVPDRIVQGAHAGIPGADLVVVSSRRKTHWDVGTVVDTGERWFRVTAIEERTIAGRLRTLYALREHNDFEAFRRRVQYTIPNP